jgi:hypothetical protein
MWKGEYEKNLNLFHYWSIYEWGCMGIAGMGLWIRTLGPKKPKAHVPRSTGKCNFLIPDNTWV